MRYLALALALLAGPAASQDEVVSASGGVLRILDKTTGDLEDVDVAIGQIGGEGRVEIALEECRYPAGNPSGDAFAFVTVFVTGLEDPAFRGWLIGSAPALHAMNHPRYDVWVLSCTTS
ncbi:DUF2155 domain-containing protein [Aestuariibius insulae]|uniref:DUF2155 domain-containing protein n=1 Tax=Aestuariibius insulae TaxID=2058287 RepID=UPI00345E4A7E